MSDTMKLILILASPLIALLELIIISFVISVLDMIFDDIGDLKKTITKYITGDNKDERNNR